jgi:hypothetical protein
MPVPNLIHPIPIHLQRENEAATIFNSRGREPVRQMWKRGQGPGTGTEDELVGQINWNDGAIKKPEAPSGGVREKSDGYVLFRFVDLLEAGIATENADGTITLGIDRGDKIVRVGRRRVELFVTYFRDIANYPDQGGGTILEVNFEDREASARG